MGTRHLTVVQMNEKYVLAHYGQWDGYLTGQGETIASFISNNIDRLDEFRSKLKNLREISDAESKQFWNECGADPASNMVSFEVNDIHKQKYPELSRDTGARILDLILNHGKTMHRMDLEFAGDSLSCEFVYVLNMDTEILEIYRGYNTQALKSNERFADLPIDSYMDGKYKQVRLWLEIPFALLTVELMAELDNSLTDDEE